MWLNKFKIAIVQKDTNTLEKLLDEVPKFDNIEDAKKATYLLKEALALLYSLQDETSTAMRQIKKNIDFLNTTVHDSVGSLDIRL